MLLVIFFENAPKASRFHNSLFFKRVGRIKMSKLKWEQLKGRCRRAKDIATFGPERKPPVEQSILPRTKQQNDPICKRCGCVTRRKTHDGPVPGKTMWYAWWFRCSRCGWQFMPKEAIRTLPSTPTREAGVYDLTPASSFIRRETPTPGPAYVPGKLPVDRPGKLPWEP
jgi:hypothetical protein